MGLPEVRNDSTQVLDSPVDTDPALKAINTAPQLVPVEPPVTAPQLAPIVAESTAPSLPPVVTPPPAPPRKTGTAIPRTKTGGVIPAGEQTAPPRRASRIAVPAGAGEETVKTTEPLKPVSTKEPFEWTMPRVAGLAGAVSLVFILLWVFWPSGNTKKKPVAERPEPVVEKPLAVAEKPKPAPEAPRPVAAPEKPSIKLDAKQHVIDPYAAHSVDLPLDPSHKYRLKLGKEDARLGVVMARLEEKEGWGVMRKMATHAMLQFGGAKTLRFHCEPGTHFADGNTVPLELTDLATKKATPLAVNPAKDCWDFEVARRLDLGEGVKKRVRVPTDAKLELGPNVPLRVAYVLESLGDTTEWKTGVLNPGESVLAEGRSARFAIIDPYAGDNEGTLALELLEGDTENAGLVTPSATGAQFVPVK
jgi:hypothetical protein